MTYSHHPAGLMASPGAYNSFGYAPSAGQIHEPIKMYIQDQDRRESVGLPYGGPRHERPATCGPRGLGPDDARRRVTSVLTGLPIMEMPSNLQTTKAQAP
jgi:hypothetical protein